MASKNGKKIIGICISSSSISFSQVSFSGGKPSIKHFVKIPTNFESKEAMQRPLTMNNAFFDEKAPWVDLFKQALRKVSWGSKEVAVTLSNEFSITRYFTMPFVDRKFWSNSIPIESKKYIPLSFEEVSYHYAVEVQPEVKRMNVLFCLTKKKTVEFLISLLKAEGFAISSIESTPVSFERLFAAIDGEHDKSAYIHFTKKASFMIFSSGRMPILFREINLGLSSQMSGRVSLDIKGALQFVSRCVGPAKYSQIKLSGDNLELWMKAAQRESPVQVKTWDPQKIAGLRENELESIFSVGSALKNQFPEKNFIDVSSISTNMLIEKKILSHIKNLTMGLCAVILFFAFVNQFRAYLVSGKINSIYTNLGDAGELKGKDPSSIESETMKLEESARVFGDLLFDKTVLAPKLEAIADNIPSYLWVDTIYYVNPFSSGGIQSGNKEMTIRGLTSLKGNLRLKFVQNFTSALKKTEAFREFAAATGNMGFNIDAQTGANVEDEYEEAKKESSYGFTISCDIKPKGG